MELFQKERVKAADSAVFRLGTVTNVYTAGSPKGITVKFDGESSTASTRFYCNTGVSFSSSDRVLCCLVSGTWVVLCKIGTPS